jgi:hypothetical protein
MMTIICFYICAASALVQNCGPYIHGAFSLRFLISDQEHHPAKNVARRKRRIESADDRRLRVFVLLSETGGTVPMSTILVLTRCSLRVLGAVAAALLTLSAVAGQRAEALSPVNPGMAAAGKTVAEGRTIEVRGGGGGHGGGGGGGGRGGGGAGFGRGFSGAAVGGGAIGAGAAAVAGGPRFGGRAFGHRRHFGGVFIGGVYYDDYPYDYPDYYDYPPVYPAPAFVAGGSCRRVLTVHGPRVVCHHRAARHHRVHRRHYHRRHHRA